ncbi:MULTISPECIES: 16S rRNA (cytidine(1402)-2'-O)-methyltransferase [unclassified Meiothermus]|uniref:16S rRNA (cytidine(1402)-2'-O)-methyltransferase n=1 Tax=unclassified Meiothermus TaxID=370471 RepID=UPI000D7C83E0|nr:MULTISPECIES: 16S rRNA (cytidine(1402)-2'-O)-methyltransferase [unclassified Meiothermus]PZA06133.1 16S rRNA (cytidine(1402)-2'-O)-methyltransferase [Meiothermus sp. Pnk-1]RYM36227.1 16S rRNA (cytidine(1402)-2'-O)-methyltransferase [Meiothermus sp. PNK-Is4]
MRLVLVPTPIGNLEDITLRALRVLREAEVVACEDTRRTGVLLQHYGLHKKMVRLDQHTIGRAKDLLGGYGYVAYATDAGTPGISDPGAELVALALREGWQVEVLPGPTALIPALVASGMPTARFAFEGFLPQRSSERKARLEQIARGRTVVLYEAPHRLRKTLDDLIELYGPEHPVALVRELSKLHEEVWRGSLEAAQEHFQEPRGEFVIVLAPKVHDPKHETQNAEELLERLKHQGLRGKALVRALVEAGVPRNQAYTLAHGESVLRRGFLTSAEDDEKAQP